MGKKRAATKSVNVSAFADASASVDELFSRVATDVSVKRGKAGEIVETQDDRLCVLPVPSLAVRYLLQSVGLLLSRVIEVVGPSASYKSTFAVEMVRWHGLCNGRGALLEAETKPTPELRNAVMHYQTNLLKVDTCQSLESWQRAAFWYFGQFKKQCSRVGGPGPTIPLAVVVDSLLGKACEFTIAKVQQAGSAMRDYAHEANLLKTWMQVFPQTLNGWPFTFIGVNHVKPMTNAEGVMERKIPGGRSVNYQEAVQIELTKLGRLQDTVNYSYVNIAIETHKNSYGREHIRIVVPLKFWNLADEHGVDRLYARWEWWEATTYLLAGIGMSEARKKVLLAKTNEIVDVHDKACGNLGKFYWSNRLGVTSSNPLSAHDFGMLLETRIDVLAELYSVMGITHRPFFAPGIAYISQQPGYGYLQQHADLSNRMYALRCGEAPPPVANEVANGNETENEADQQA